MAGDDERLMIQNQYKPIIKKFNVALINNTYDLDNNVDNGIFPDNSYLDGNESRYTKFIALGNILMEKNNVNIVTIQNPVDSNKYILKGVSKVFENSLTIYDEYVIGEIDTDEQVNKYLNFEYLHRLYGFLEYENIDVDDDEMREELHNYWLTEKAKFFPNGVSRSTSISSNKSTKNTGVGGDDIKKEKDNSFQKRINKFIYSDMWEFDNPFLKKAKKNWIKAFELQNPTQRISKKNKKEAVINGKPTLAHIGNTGSYDAPKNATVQEERREKQEKLKIKKTRDLFIKDLKNRSYQLISHFIYAISFMMISFIHFPNTKEYFKKGCVKEFPNCNDQPSKVGIPFLVRLAFMNHSEPIRLIKSIPVISMILGFSYLMNCRSLLYSKLKVEMTTMFGVIFALFFGIYLCYQLLLLSPMHHENVIGCCISRRLWAADSENLLFLLAIAMTFIATPFFLALFFTYAGVVPFLLVFLSMFINFENYNYKVFSSNDTKLVKKIFLFSCATAIFLGGAEVLKCVNDYYRNDGLATFNEFTQGFINLLGYCVPFVLIAISLLSPTDVIQSVNDNISGCAGACDAKDKSEKLNAVRDKIASFVGMGTGVVADGVIGPIKELDNQQNEMQMQSNEKIAGIIGDAVKNLNKKQ